MIAARMLPRLVEGGPDWDRCGGLIPSYVDSGLVYDLMHLWIGFEGLGWVYLKLTTEEIELVVEEPEVGDSDPFFLRSEGFWVPATHVAASHAPAPLATLVGATVTEVTPLYYEWPPRPGRWWRRAREADEEDYVETGLILETTKGTVAIADVGDEYAIGAWPDDARWNAINVVTNVDPRRVPRSVGSE